MSLITSKDTLLKPEFPRNGKWNKMKIMMDPSKNVMLCHPKVFTIPFGIYLLKAFGQTDDMERKVCDRAEEI